MAQFLELPSDIFCQVTHHLDQVPVKHAPRISAHGPAGLVEFLFHFRPWSATTPECGPK